jgi:hypothetical protein
MARPVSSEAQAQTLALHVPRWRGVSASTTNLFERRLPVPLLEAEHPDSVSRTDINIYAEAISALPITKLVISGGDPFMLALLRRVRAIRSDIDGRLLWHSNFLQIGDAHDYKLMEMWISAARSGDISTFGVVKRGLDRFLGSFGIKSKFIQNRIDADYASVSHTQERARVGMWLSGSSAYRKLPYNTLCALSEVDGVELVGAGLDSTAMKLVKELRLTHGELEQKPLPVKLLMERMSRTALTLYVTSSECMPMLPLESIALGVPCLVGASSHFLADDAELEDIYVVKDMGSPAAIARKIKRALDEGESAFPKLRQYMCAWNARSIATVEEFLA